MFRAETRNLMKPVIRLEHIEKVFHDGKDDFEALRDVSLDVEEGDIFGIIGLSGAGKSTLVRCLNLLERPTSGKVFLHGQDMTALSPAEIRRCRQKIGLVFQHFNLLMQRTVLGNVCFPLEIVGMSKKDAKKRAMEVLKLVGIADKANAYPSQLSGGQKQRVAIARVLANDPEIILCDEATSALDPMTTESILSLLQTINQTQHITIVVITHEMKVVQQICNRVAVLDEGRIQETGPVSEVFTHPQTKAAKRLVLARMQDADAPCVKLALPEDEKELADLMAYVKAHNLKVLEGEEHV